MSLWLMYDYVIASDIVLEDTMVVYDDSSQGEATPELTKAKDLSRGKDLILLYNDVAKWKFDTTTDKVINPSKDYSLGPSTRAVTCKPPKRLLDAISQA